MIEPHRPVHTIEYGVCGVGRRHYIGRNPASDPIHDLSGWCKCGSALPAFVYQCDACAVKVRIAKELARQARLAVATYEEPREVRPDPEQSRGTAGDPDPVRKARFNEAVAFIREYRGNFGLILSLRAHRAWGTKWFRLSDRQIDAVLACKARQGQVQQIAVPVNLDLSRLPVGRTYAAVENIEGGLTFLIFDRPEQGKWQGWTFVKQQQGPNEVRLGSARPEQGYVGQWPTLIERVLDDPMAAVIRYGQELGVCGVCGLPLTNEESRQAGIGPVCRKRMT